MTNAQNTRESVRGLPRPVNSKALEVLDTIRARMESGEIVDVAIAGTLSGGGCTTVYTGDGDVVLLAGAISRLAHRFDANELHRE